MITVGQTVGNYRVTAKLGEGGMGAVFLAEHPVIGRRAALKVIHPRHARNAEVLTRFVNEATAINRIGHDHIVEVTDFGRTPEGDFYFIMEYLEGHPLSELIEREAPVPPARALAITAQIADALSASHAHGVIHRDLKPENIFLVTRGGDPSFVKVLDFGLAKLVSEEAGKPNQTSAGTVMGTPYYMAPEQCQGRSELDQRADVYSLGVVLFEMLTGKLPFGGEGYAEVLMKQISNEAPSVRSLVPALPAELDVILERALAKRPDDRFATMAAFRDALLEPEQHRAAQARAEIRDDPSGRMRVARPMSRAEIISADLAAPEKAGAPPLPLPLFRRRPAASAVALGVVAVGGLALAIVLLTRGESHVSSGRRFLDAATVGASDEVARARVTRPPKLASVADPFRETTSPSFTSTSISTSTSTSSTPARVSARVVPVGQSTSALESPHRRRAQVPGASTTEHHGGKRWRYDDGDGVLAPSFLK